MSIQQADTNSNELRQKQFKKKRRGKKVMQKPTVD